MKSSLLGFSSFFSWNVPKEIRERFGLNPNTEVDFEVVHGSIVLKKTPKKLGIGKWQAVTQAVSVNWAILQWPNSSKIFADDDTAVDTNILLDILIPNERFFEASADRIERSAVAGSLIVCDPVYAELCIHFDAQRECDGFLDANGIRVERLNRGAFLSKPGLANIPRTEWEANGHSGGFPHRRSCAAPG